MLTRQQIAALEPELDDLSAAWIAQFLQQADEMLPTAALEGYAFSTDEERDRYLDATLAREKLRLVGPDFDDGRLREHVREHVLAYKERLGRTAEIEDVLRSAASLLERATDRTPYDARRDVVKWFRADSCNRGRANAFKLHPEPAIWLADHDQLPAWEPTDEFAFRSCYVPAHIEQRPDDELPEAAIPDIIRAMRDAPTEHHHFPQSDGHDLVDAVLRRYGVRAVGYMLLVMSAPDDFTYEGSGSIDRHRMLSRIVHAAWGLEDQAGLEVLRAAIEAGWNRMFVGMPESPIREQLREAYADSPYGAPLR